MSQVDELDTSLRQKSQAELKCRRDENAAVAADESSTAIWTEEEARLLVKAVTIFPVGTKSRC